MKTKLTHSILTQVLLILPLASISLAATRLQSKIYTHLDDSLFCFRRFNETHQIGCSSSESGNTGVVMVVREHLLQDDLEFVLHGGSDAPYVVVLNAVSFTQSTLLQLKKSPNRVAGVVVLDRVDTDQLTEDNENGHFSADRSCPNERFSLYANNSQYSHCKAIQWNSMSPNFEHHEGLLFYDWPFPIFLLQNKTQIKLFLNKTKEFEYNQWPKLAIQLTSPMSGAKDSLSCTRRSLTISWFSLNPEQYCDPMGGTNVYHHNIASSDQRSSIANNSVVVLAARLDSFSMFDNLSPGADSAITSLITMMAIAEVLNRDPIKSSLANKEKSYLLSLFDGEAFDYLGSSFAVNQLVNNDFPLFYTHPSMTKEPLERLNLNQISHFIELNQLASYNKSAKQQNLYLHKHLDSRGSDELRKLIRSEAVNFNNLIVSDIKGVQPLPPSSAQSVLKERNDDKLSVVVVTNHEYAYINKYYNSYAEDGSQFANETGTYLANIATLITRVVYKLIQGSDMDKSVVADESLVRDLMHCFLKTSSCQYFKYVQGSTKGTNQDNRPTLPTYVSVYGVGDKKPYQAYVHGLMHLLTGTAVAGVNSSIQCYQMNKQQNTSETGHRRWNYVWLNGRQMNGECIRSNVYTQDVISPAFNSETLEIFPDRLAKYAAWTESKWKGTSFKMFVVSSRTQQILTLMFGIFVLLFSLIIVYYCHANSGVFFADENGEYSPACRSSIPSTDGIPPPPSAYPIANYDAQ